MLFLISSIGTVFSESFLVPTNKLDYNSRYIFQLNSTDGQPYKVYIVPLKEVRQTDYAWANKSEHVVTGEYVPLVAKTSNADAILQEIYLFGLFNKNSINGTFNLNKTSYQNRAFVVSGKNNNPDILFVAQQVTGSGDAAIRGFYIDASGSLKIIYWKNNDGQLLNSTYIDGFHQIKYDNNNLFIPGWSRNSEYSGGTLTTWTFYPDQQTCIFKEKARISYDE